ncbi:hypothetical protein L9F63_022532 [Diploptera punctata]|uniref:Uncharacterized protein n=1 Tax=Diploptera punctata TaxID=6984 RepID=A0AAD7ZNR4_DIPPU|nr:hypothetical protein L9F63_022532 [Diploptera punctata]
MTLKSTDRPPPPSPTSAPPPPELTALWDMESADYECDCPGPPPEFRLPPPPRPPFLQESSGMDCSEAPIPDLETCDAVPVIDAEYHSSPAIPSIAVIVVCSVLLLVMVLIASVLVWKHKRKMQNFLPCKTSPQNHCDVSNGNGVIYEDLTNIRPRTLPNHCVPGQTAPSIEMIDVKSGANYNSGFPVLGNPSVFICPPPRPDPYTSQDLYNPVYEELSNGSGDRGESDPDSEGAVPAPASEDEFAEDELSLGGECEGSQPGHPQHLPEDLERNSGASSLQGSTGNDLCRDLDSSDADDRSRFLGAVGRNFSLPPGYRNRISRPVQGHQHRSQHSTEQRRPRSLDRRRGRNKCPPQISPQSPARHQDCGEFHRRTSSGCSSAVVSECRDEVGEERQYSRPSSPTPGCTQCGTPPPISVTTPSSTAPSSESRSESIRVSSSLEHLHQHHTWD